MRNRLFLICLGLLLGSLGCTSETGTARVNVMIRTESDPGEALAGVTVTANTQSLGATSATGELAADIVGEAGSSVQLAAVCPAGHRSGVTHASVALRPVFDTHGAPRPLTVTLSCPPASRRGIVVIRAAGGATGGLPVLVDGAPVGVTDTSGVAHVTLESEPGHTFRVQLATATVQPALQPSDPAMTFQMADRDEIFVFDQTFEVAAPPPVTRPHPPRPRDPEPEDDDRPVQITSGGRLLGGH